MDLDEYFSTGPAHERPVFDAVMAALEPVGPVHVEPVSVGIFLKRAQTFAQLRPMTRWESLSFWLPREERHPLITRKVNRYGDRWWHVANVRDPTDVDDRLATWLAEAYHLAPE
ncbi:hypothetical protein KSP35_07765 [Aquihabitans sp. G128]|uniref:DUF5655 domain-containing protein n=1 Tax=Aquihabitans sp. G128 TaxID=2849779 RepID=UPI001C2288A7|nr:DUF5655 domain-containing protein [Aquihabitans sp. G128]QXC62681.1 hypothetical protein KSP35_07765 [Aquihabitans sp. G128]